MATKMIGKVVASKVNGLLKQVGGITIERPNMKMWRGHKVPFIVYVRKHYDKLTTDEGGMVTYKRGSYVWFNLIGPDFHQWCKDHRVRKES